MERMMNANREEQQRIAEQAAEWLRTLESAGKKEREAFTRWLHASPLHVRELLMMTAWDRALAEMDPERKIDIDTLLTTAGANVVPLRSAQPSAKIPSRVSPRKWAWLAGAAVIAALGVFSWRAFESRVSPESYATAIGEQRTFELDDGSLVYLNTQSRVEVDITDTSRELTLVSGEALFKVHHDAARPFRVRTDDAVVLAVGTQFNVLRRDTGTFVSVVEGRVRVNDGPIVSAGQEVTVSRQGEVRQQAVAAVDDALAWRQRRLVFRKESLADIAAEFNRYNAEPQIRVEGELLSAREFNGVFDADEPETLLKYLSTDPHIAFEQRGDEIVIRPR